MRIEPAEPAFDGNGTPYSLRFGDVYHSADSGPRQALHVFVGGNDLPRRWAGARVFTIMETGFGLGINFLATWRAWRDDPRRPQRLHFVSIEKHPFARESLERLHAQYPELAPLARELRDAWPPLVSGLHRLRFEGGAVTLTLAFGDVADVLPKLRLCADAIYLDGFAPARNPDMWSAHTLKALAHLSRVGTTLATYSTAAHVREALAAAGFAVDKRPGFGRKREMLAARFEPRWRVVRTMTAAPEERHAIVIGAGIAGAAVCGALASRGWRIDLLEARSSAENRRSRRFAGVFHPLVSSDDAIRSRLSRSGFLHAVAEWRALEASGHAPEWDRCGVVQLAADSVQESRMAEAAARLALPSEYARYVARDEARALSGCAIPAGGWWFPGGGWIRPASLVGAEIDAARDAVRARFECAVSAIRRDGGRWSALGSDGAVLAAAPVLVFANAADAQRFAAFGDALARVRGQVTYLPAGPRLAPQVAITGRGYVLPPDDGIVVAGSTYDSGNANPALEVRGHEMNLAHLARLVPDAPAFDAQTLGGAVGFRCAAPDRVPIVGAIPDIGAVHGDAARYAAARLGDLPRIEGLYCSTAFASRGLVWASLAAEIVASRVEGEPPPLESDLEDAIDPARFILRRLRRGRLRECALHGARHAPGE
jgi:tRNA 5-methylaminomethyl-2-thiouridine biosynthesis bifunctional protein